MQPPAPKNPLVNHHVMLWKGKMIDQWLARAVGTFILVPSLVSPLPKRRIMNGETGVKKGRAVHDRWHEQFFS